jgi:hypothetical protein
MSFLLPHFLWGLLGLLPLLAVYLIRVHPIRRKTSAWFLWEGIFQERRAASWLQKMRDWLSLMIMVLIFILLVLALAQPVLNRQRAAERLVLIVDNSLSMNADGRLDEACRKVRGFIRSLPAGGRAAVFSLSGELLSATGFTSSHRELIAGLDSIVGSDVPMSIESLAHLGGGDENEQQRILLFSDGCFRGADHLPEHIELVKVGKPAPNLGITALDVRRVPGEGMPLGIFFSIHSSEDKTVEVDAVLSYGASNDVHRIFPLEIEPGKNEPMITYIPNGEAGRWTLTLEHRDAMDRDNTAYAVVPEFDPVNIVVHAPDTRIFWELCVEAFGNGINGLQIVEQDADLELYRGVIPDAPVERLAVFAPAGNSPFWKQVSGEPFEAAARVVLPSHPLMKYIDMDGVIVHGVRDIRLPDQAVVLAETDEGAPLIYKTTQQGRSAYVLNFDPAENHFFLHPLFPVMVWSIAHELMGGGLDASSSLPPGSAVVLPSGLSAGTVSLPSGEELLYSEGRFGMLEQFGFYRFSGDDGLLDLACSGVPVVESGLDNSGISGAEVALISAFPLSEWFLGAAVFLLALECTLYHRRKVG